MTDTIQPWALAEARKRGGAPPAPYSDGSLNALALMIQTHETEPVPWDLKRAREICDATWPNYAYLTGVHDDLGALRAVRAALNEPRPAADYEQLKYLCKCVESHADKFPEPQDMLDTVALVRAAFLTAPNA